ncbi:hypothetical protein SAMN05421858_4616 [Haladaptatus litoreus]|uniref:DUF7344 domain-containing protein n=1 Tax=Haladaptatus litoreus TaxID=553468 RepID=A0A1N7EXT7_9EURY|nr:hypothetical protein SAMN05421858_4616 [Haladaptatus litoreus]
MSDTHRTSDDHDNGAPPTKPPTATRPVASLPVEALCSLLVDARVRAVLRAFEHASEFTLDQSTVVEELVSRSPQPREDIRLQLRHIVLPKLTTSGILEYEAEGIRIRYHPHSRLTTLLKHADNDPNSIQDRCFDALGHPQRRLILAGLVDAENGRALTAITLGLMRTDGNRVSPERSGREFQQARTALIHKHLPRLVANELITYRDASETVAMRETPAAQRLPSYVTTLDAVERE